MNENESIATSNQTSDSLQIGNNLHSAMNAERDSESIRTIRKLNEEFADRLKEYEDSGKVSEEKLEILQQWVDSLTEQNIMLVEVVETFEKEAVLQLKVGFESQKLQNKELQVLQQQMTCKNRIIDAQHKALQKLKIPIGVREEELIDQNVATSSVMETIKKQLESVESEKETLKKNVADVENKMDKLNQMMVVNEKNAREMRAALTAEVAEKHDQVLALRRETQHLEDRLRQADMQTHFKDDIIKELRKEIKIANNKLVGQLRDRDVAVCNLEEKLKIFKSLPIELSSQLNRLKQGISNLNELLGQRNGPKNDVHLVLNSILFSLNEALILVDGYKTPSEGGAYLLKPDSRQHKSSSNISDLSRNQNPLVRLMNDLQSLKKILDEDKLGCKKMDDDIRTILNSVCNNNRNECREIVEAVKYAMGPIENYFTKQLDNKNDHQNLTLKNLLESVQCIRSLIGKIDCSVEISKENDLYIRVSSLQNQLKKHQDSKDKIYHKLCYLQSDQKDKSSILSPENTYDGRHCNVTAQEKNIDVASIGLKNVQSEISRDFIMKKLTNDLHELNLQLKSREKIITNQQETIELLQNSLQMEQTEVESLKLEKEKADSDSQALQAKVLLLEAELKMLQETLGANNLDPATLANGKMNSLASKTWAPWSGKQALPSHRHIHDV